MDDSTVSGVMTSSDGDAASPAATPVVTDTTTADVPVTETASVAPTDPAGDPATPAIGPIPYDRFKQVNTRMQEAERRVKEIQDSYGEVLGLPAEQAKQVVAFARQMAADPVATAIQLSEQLMSHPSYGPAMASQAARWLQSRRGQAQQAAPAEEPEPQPDLVADNGVPVYSAPQMRKWREWSDKATEARILQRIAPLERQAQTITQERHLAEVRQKADAQATALLNEAKAWHGFVDHQESITKAFQEHPDWTLEKAYLHVLHSEILPQMPAQAQAKVVAQLQQKAAAQTMNPAGGAPPAKPDFKGDFKAALEWAAKNNR